MAESKGYAAGQFCWHECSTRDAAAARRFYEDVIGWEAQEVPMPQGGHYTLFQLQGKDMAGLYEMSGPQFEGVPPHWMSYIHVDDVDAAGQKAESLGGKLMAGPFDVPNVGRMAVIQDPTGAVVSLMKLGEHPGEAQLGPVAGTFCWNELSTPNADAAGSFYSQLLPWNPEPMDMPSGGKYTMFKMGEASAGGMMPMTPEMGEVPPHWMPYITVDSCDGTIEKAKSAGGELIHPTTDIGFGKFAILKDPTGVVVSIFEFNPAS